MVAVLGHSPPYATADGGGSERVELTRWIYRQVNERIRELSRRYELVEPAQMFCECCEAACAAAIHVDPGQYDEITMQHTRFLVAPGHAGPQDSVIERTSEYWVVEADSPGGNAEER